MWEEAEHKQGKDHIYLWVRCAFPELHIRLGGLERWTDGRRWFVIPLLPTDFAHCLATRSQSRMRGDYLFYEEKIETTPEEKEAKAARRCVTISFSLIKNPLTLHTGLGGHWTHFPINQLPPDAKIGRRSLTGSRSKLIPLTCTSVIRNLPGNGT